MNSTLKAPRPATTQDETAPAPADNGTPAATKPLAVFRYEHVSAAVFIDRKATKDADAPLYSITLRRHFRDASGAWKSSHVLWPSDLLAAAHALQKCFAFVHEDQPEDAASA
jgi:hypothetical protein